MPDRALFLGRFQPLHLGHLHVVERLARLHDEVIVGIGSANVSHTPSNPFSGGERLAMVRSALAEAGIANAYPALVPDVGRNAIFPAHVASLVPRFSTLYTNNPLMARLFTEQGHRVLPAPFHHREHFEGRKVRALMQAGDEWVDLVPPAVARLVRECDGIARLRALGNLEGVVVEGRDASV